MVTAVLEGTALLWLRGLYRLCISDAGGNPIRHLPEQDGLIRYKSRVKYVPGYLTPRCLFSTQEHGALCDGGFRKEPPFFVFSGYLISLFPSH